MRQIINLADEKEDQHIKQHSFAQLYSERPGSIAAPNRHRMLVFEDEIMKRRDSVHEVRATRGASRVLTKLGLVEEEQHGFAHTKCGHGTAIYTAASAIEDASIRDKEIWIEFKDQEKAFDAGRFSRESDGVHGTWNTHKNWNTHEIIHEYGTTAETLGFHAGRLRRNAEEAMACGKGPAAC
jgi:hypothetical protein